jgi:hypothetical protein
LLAEATARLGTNFGDLQSIKMWRSLFNHLCNRAASFQDATISYEPPECDLVNITTLLFQALCPVRFAFLDGQARMLAVSHYIRQVLPQKDPSILNCLESMSDFVDSHGVGKAWSLHETGMVANCRLVVCNENIDVENLSDDCIRKDTFELLRDMHSISRTQCANFDKAERFHFSQGITTLISELGVRKPRDPTQKMGTVASETCKLFEVILQSVDHLMLVSNSKRPEDEVIADEGKSFDEFFMDVMDGTVLFPRLATRHCKVSVVSVKILMHVLGAALADKDCCIMMEKLMNDGWKVPFDLDGTIEGLDVALFHKGTFISNETLEPKSRKEPTSFETFLFQVCGHVTVVLCHNI